jgi:hypothetical protein
VACAAGVPARWHREDEVAKYPIKKIRPLALLGQAGSGKHGDSTCAYLPIEKRLHHSLKLPVASFEGQP